MSLASAISTNLAEVHHRDAIGDMPDRAQVVRDEQVSQILLALQLLQQIHDLRLDGNIERRDRFISDDEVRIDCQCARDADALALSAGKLVRITLDETFAETDCFQQVLARVGLLPFPSRVETFRAARRQSGRPSFADSATHMDPER